MAPDVWGGSASSDAPWFFFPASEQLEPMLPEGLQKGVAWEERGWHPGESTEEVFAG